jgi:glutaredoxin
MNICTVEDKMKKYLLLFILLSFCLCKIANADYYKWVDENGNTQITDYPPPENKPAKDVQIHKYQAEDSANLQDDQKSSAKNKTKKVANVVLYTKNDCIDCDKARDYLTSKNIPFIEYNMDKDKKASIQRKAFDDSDDVPFAIINKNNVFGFSESVYDKVLKVQP